jgi:hypothetical protein
MADGTLNKFLGTGTTAERLAFTPVPPSPATPPGNGYTFWDADLQTLYAWDDGTAAWVAVSGGGGGITELTGDVTAGPGSGSEGATIAANAVTTAKILNSNVTLAKIANAAANSTLLGSGAAGSGSAYAELTLGTGLSMAGTTLNAATGSANPLTVGVTVDGGGSVITTGQKGYIQCPISGTVTSWTLLADQSGSVEFDVTLDAFASYPPTTSIVAAAPPELTAADSDTDSTLTGWTTAVTAGDVFGFEVVSAATVERVTLQIVVTP